MSGKNWDTAVRANEMVRGERGITADTARRLGRVFGTMVQMWLNLQYTYELRKFKTSTSAEAIARLRPFDMLGATALKSEASCGAMPP